MLKRRDVLKKEREKKNTFKSEATQAFLLLTFFPPILQSFQLTLNCGYMLISDSHFYESNVQVAYVHYYSIAASWIERGNLQCSFLL